MTAKHLARLAARRRDAHVGANAWWLVLATGCFSHETVTVAPWEIEHVRAQLQAGHRATVESGVELAPDQEVDLQTVAGHLRIRLDALLKDCPSEPAGTDQICNHVYINSVVISDHRHFELGRSLRTALVVGIFAGLAACTFACESPFNYLTGGLLVVTGTILVVDLALLANTSWKVP